MIFKSTGKTHIGKVRLRNEDNLLIDDRLGLFIVCDGMGGHQRGDVASKITLIEIKNFLIKNKFILEGFYDEKPTFDKTDVINLLKSAIEYANESIYLQGDINSELKGMGATLSVLLILKDRAFIGHVGDTRIYLLRKNEFHLLTEDHSLFSEFVRQGKVPSSSLQKFPFKNVVTKAVGVHPSIEPYTLTLNIFPDDKFLISSDGLHGYFEDDELKNFLNEKDINLLVDTLIEKANEAGGDDNITAIVVDILEGGNIENECGKIQLQAINSLPLFASLSYTEKLLLLDMCEFFSLNEKEYLFKKGESADKIYILLSGKVKIFREDMEIVTFEPFCHFGEMSLIEGGVRLASAMAIEKSEFLTLNRRKFLTIINQSPHLAVKLLWNLTNILTSRLKATNDELLLLKTYFNLDKGEFLEILPSEALEDIDMEMLTPPPIPHKKLKTEEK